MGRGAPRFGGWAVGVEGRRAGGVAPRRVRGAPRGPEAAVAFTPPPRPSDALSPAGASECTLQ